MKGKVKTIGFVVGVDCANQPIVVEHHLVSDTKEMNADKKNQSSKCEKYEVFKLLNKALKNQVSLRSIAEKHSYGPQVTII